MRLTLKFPKIARSLVQSIEKECKKLDNLEFSSIREKKSGKGNR